MFIGPDQGISNHDFVLQLRTNGSTKERCLEGLPKRVSQLSLFFNTHGGSHPVQKLQQHETISTSLKNREYSRRVLVHITFGLFNEHVFGAVRFSLKDLEKDYAKTEDDIKAVQSVGQIIGEVMKQLDDERCELRFALSFLLAILKSPSSYREGVFRPTIRSLISADATGRKTQSGDSS